MGLGNGPFQTSDGQGIFRPHIDIAGFATNGVSGNGHALQNRMRVSFDHCPVHECPWIAFIRVTHHIFGCAFGGQSGFPFPAGRKSAAAPAPQAGCFHDIHHFLLGHIGQGFVKPFISLVGNVMIDIGGIDNTAVAEYPAFLGFERRGVQNFCHAFDFALSQCAQCVLG